MRSEFMIATQKVGFFQITECEGEPQLQTDTNQCVTNTNCDALADARDSTVCILYKHSRKSLLPAASFVV